MLTAMAMIVAAQTGGGSDGSFQAFSAQLERWRECAARAAGHYARISDEPAAVVIEAAFGRCQTEERAVQTAMVEVSPTMTSARREELMRASRARYAEQLTAGIMDLRSKPKK